MKGTPTDGPDTTPKIDPELGPNFGPDSDTPETDASWRSTLQNPSGLDTLRIVTSRRLERDRNSLRASMAAIYACAMSNMPGINPAIIAEIEHCIPELVRKPKS